MTPPILEAKGLNVAFNGVKAADDVSIAIHDGEFLAIIGPNGSGKTTLVDLIAGRLRPLAGTIELEGHRLEGTGPPARARHGLMRTFQDATLVQERMMAIWMQSRPHVQAAAETGGIQKPNRRPVATTSNMIT